MPFMLILLLLLGCSSDSNPIEQSGDVSIKIANGSNDEHKQVLYIRNSDGGACSTSLIAPNVLLTAKHCVAKLSEININCDIDNYISHIYKPNEISVFSDSTSKPITFGKSIIVTDSNKLCNEDIALVILDRDLDSPTFNVSFKKPTLGDNYILIGFGLDEFGNAGNRKSIDITVWAVGPSILPRLDSYEFDVTIGAMKGDSGGPAMKDGYVYGVVSRGEGGTNENIMTSTYGFLDLFALAEQQSGYKLIKEEVLYPEYGCNTSSKSNYHNYIILLFIFMFTKRLKHII